MPPVSSKVTVFFDLDGTLFDHHHSLSCGISAIRQKYPALASFDLTSLITQYNTSLQSAYDEYLQKIITYEETDYRKIRLFVQGLGLDVPDDAKIAELRDIYRPAYRGSRRATPGSIETLVWLRKKGVCLGIITNGQAKDQLEKATAIGVQHLVDYMITSEEAGCCKPDRGIFRLAIDAFGCCLSETYMVGDSVGSDIRGALDIGINPILFSPISTDSHLTVSGKTIPIIQNMSQLVEMIEVSLGMLD
ncbi:hypothetical protein CABS01_00824 [Colletotrichum abscissum]|uniref:HAD family hydrolase n=1 Tax=Colletotrichum abscissum TaxID=1671311 RepID=A0A9P9XMM2_9PEZI|nr:uncharacterized protein CABS01_00824 [Colletotrichum abscissum]KAI3556763.1 hypothetical protein CABS02_03204 [Colletotrichum abscissum]KAK1505356.1 hypothetical protein CABS01_00824 [Colletotrichum abscissum]